MLSPHFNHLIFKVLGFVLLALVSACGGGGGGGSTLRFEQILWGAGAVAAVKDNTTGLVWASQPAVNEQSPGSSPTVQELLTLTDAGKNAIAEYFPLFLNQEIQSNEFKTITEGDTTQTFPWIVHFLPNELGVLRYGEPISGTPFSSLRVLNRTSEKIQPKFLELDSDANLVLQGDLMWHMCTYGSDSKNDAAGSCSGKPLAVGFNEAKAIALRENYAGYSNWRLPTKQELQKLLNLSNDNGPMLNDPFYKSERVNLTKWLETPGSTLEYWTSTEAEVENPDPTDPIVWNVSFDFSEDMAGVFQTNVSTTSALVRLVRNR